MLNIVRLEKHFKAFPYTNILLCKILNPCMWWGHTWS